MTYRATECWQRYPPMGLLPNLASTGWILLHWLLSVYFFARHRKTPHKFGENLNYWCKSTEPLSWGKIADNLLLYTSTQKVMLHAAMNDSLRLGLNATLSTQSIARAKL